MQAFEYDSIPNDGTLGSSSSSRFSRITSFVLTVLALSVVFFAGRRSFHVNDNSPTGVKGDLNEKYASEMVKIAEVAAVTPAIKPTITPTLKPSITPTSKPIITPTSKPTDKPTDKPAAAPTTMQPQPPTRRPKASPTNSNKPVFKANSNPYPTSFVSCSEYTTNYGCSEDKAVSCYCDDDSRCCADEDGDCKLSKKWHTWLASSEFCRLA